MSWIKLEIEEPMEKYYGKEEGDSVFYASINKGKIKGAEKKKKKDGKLKSKRRKSRARTS